MIDWDTLITPESSEQTAQNTGNCRNKAGFVGTEIADCRNTESIDSCGSSSFVPTIPTIPTSFEGGRKEKENHAPGEGVASDNFRATETHPINPIAVTLLLTCCNKATINKEETLEAIWKLQTIPQWEQVKSWAILCHNHGIDPVKTIRPYYEARTTGTSCHGCKHLDMKLIPTDGRSVYRFTCAKHHGMLELHFIGERVLIAPDSCSDYQARTASH
ncbi:hypothetical protein [Nitrosomonas sp. sh817]|uniref:hypothetical protein n=1 Tax=Nitrosomonas sp. sh817 TaxID=3070658 RepID=UPI0027DAED07|nr:hypothetical protein [Nitrosomonas sp. sh817]WMJ09360.1 hypothetical protein RBH92_03990 [Nitrosomonas sp. sh817]